jgi:hypothetical protein
LEGERETVASPVLDVWVKLDCALDALNQERERTNIEKVDVILTRCLLESPVIFILLLMFNVIPAGTVTVAQLCMAETSVGASSLPVPSAVTEQGTVARSVTPGALAAIERIKRQLQTNPTATSLELEGRISERMMWRVRPLLPDSSTLFEASPASQPWDHNVQRQEAARRGTPKRRN